MQSHKSQKNKYKSGDVVKRGGKKSECGILLSESLVHTGYWEVMKSGDIVTWFESNFTKVDDHNDREKTPRL